MFVWSWSLSGALLLALAVPALAQQGTAEIQGRVTDPHGGALRGVSIVLTDEDTGAVRTVTSTADGRYAAPQLAPGRYQVRATLQGFHEFTRGDLILQVGMTLTVNASLRLASVQQTVTISDDPPLVDTTSAKVGGTIGMSELTELPAINRNSFASVALQ